MRPPILAVATLLLAIPVNGPVAQGPRGTRALVGARVKAETQPAGRTVEGTVLPSSSDTLVLRADLPGVGRGDTVRIAAAALKNLRVVESPALWRYTRPTDINFFVWVVIPGLRAVEPAGAGPFPHVVVVASKTELAALDAATGTPIWTRQDLADLRGEAFDIVQNTGYGVLTRGEKMEVIDFRTGETRWDTGALSLLSARGWLGVPGVDPLVLMYGGTGRSASTLMAVELATGKLRWRQDSLFTVGPKAFVIGGVSYLLGHQPPLGAADTSLILYLSTEGPIRVHARTGALLWRSDALRAAKIPTLRDGYARMARQRGSVFVPSEKGLLALRVADGRPAWGAPRLFKSQVTWMAPTPRGLLVRGDDWLDLLDPGTGQSVWRAPVSLKSSTRLVLRGDTVYVAADKKVLAIQLPDGSVRTLAAVSFKGGEVPTAFGVWDAGLVLGSWHNLMLVDRQGTVRYHHAYPSPKENFGELMRRGGGGAGTQRPTTRWGSGFVFFFTGERDEADREGFSLVKVDPANGREAGRLWFDERAPAYNLESGSSTVYYQHNPREVVALKFADMTALAHAAGNGHAALVQRALDLGVDPNAATDDGWTALHVAALGGHADVVRLLLTHGARLDAPTRGGWTPWMLAALEGRADVAQTLRSAAGVQGSDATAGLLDGWHLAHQGKIAEALAAYAGAQALDSTLALWPGAWREVCWHGGLTGQAAEVMPQCEKAVERTPPADPRHASARFARALARALTGNLEGAAADLEASVDSEDEDAASGLRDWIDALREGRNPFTAAVLESLRH